MSKLKRNLFLLVVTLLTAKAVYAAVVPIVDTKASSSYGATYSSTSSGGNGHTSTYSGVECGAKTASSPEGCNTLLGIDNAIATPCDGGKYTCSAPAQKAPSRAASDEDDELCQEIDVTTQYLNPGETCSAIYGPGSVSLTCEGTSVCYCDTNEYKDCPVNTIPSGDWCQKTHNATKKYYAACDPLPRCINLSTETHAETTDTEEACQTKLGDGVLLVTPCMDGATRKYYCQWKDCSNITNATVVATAGEKSSAENQGGKEAGVCWNKDSKTQNTIMVCGDDYTINEAENTSCTGAKTPRVCNLEGTPKYHKTECKCSYELYPWTKVDCQLGLGMDYQVAGPSCDAGGNIFYFAYCLPICNDSDDGRIVDFGDSCQDDGNITFPQDYWTCNQGSTSSSPFTCNEPKTTHCCDTKSMTCYRQYTPKNASSAYCFPQGKNVDTKNLCSDPNTFEAKWQCTCPASYITKEDCEKDHGKVDENGNKCLFDGVVKYEKCEINAPCPSEDDNTIVQTEDECKPEINISCLYSKDATTTEKRFWCKCAENKKSLIEFCENKAGITGNNSATKSDRLASCKANGVCASCLSDFHGTGTSSCVFEAKENNQTLKEFVKWDGDFATSCETEKELRGDISILRNEEDCKIGDSLVTTKCTYQGENTIHYICACPASFKTIDELCSEQAASEKITVEECKKNYSGTSPFCSYDTDPITKKEVIKYSGLSYACPSNATLVDTQSGCQLENSNYSGLPKACTDSTGTQKYYCTCPPTFGTECETAGEIRGGQSCTFESLASPSYEKCLPLCDEAIGKLAVDDENSCPYIDGIEAKPTGQCFKSKGTFKVSYQCGCPVDQGFQTLEEFCGDNGVTYAGRNFSKDECINNFVGQGSVCTYEGDRKYKKFVLVCPKDRPLYYTPENCSENGINGSVDYVCQDRGEPVLEKIVCKCPSSWLLPSGTSSTDGSVVCDLTTQEASGKICDFEGYNNIKYEKCYPLCDKMSTNGQGIHYLEDDKAYEYDCRNLLGEGARFGTDNAGGKCSKNHVLFTPCYCGADYNETCANDENKRPAENVSTCTINGTTYYNSCQFNECKEESSTLAIVELSDGDTADSKCKAQYGSGATGRACGTNQAECSCDIRTYTETCDYPFTKPTNASYCKYGEGSTLMKNGTEHYKLGECKVRPLLALCGKHILKPDGTQDTSPTIYVTETEAQCKGRYGNGAQTQLCEFEENTNKRAFNCYFSLSEFPYTEDNCPIRHVLSKEYVTINGKPHYKSCNCHSAYKYHKYNCAGMLSGGACSQKVTSDMLSTDKTLHEANVSVGTEISQYPYCQCTADYNQTCDGERYIGVGTPCNDKYIACECKKDELPENWTDNYYGCPGGKKPTGVTKPNGCGGKYYQCSVTDCTWQHTETCKAPLIGVDGCQDNQGNIGGYKSCRCPDGYKTCNNGMAGKGDPCILNGEYYYTDCEDKTTCVHGETLTCQQEFLVGVNPCTRNDVTYFEYCKCSAGFDKLCENGEVGVGQACKLNGKEYYQSCTKPTMECTSEHKAQCDVMQEKYDPCVNSDNQLMYKCKCPSNWSTCEGDMGATDADTCVDSTGTRYFSQCPVSEACTPMQEKTYKTCTDAQKGTGNSCVTSEGITKYAECEGSTACRANGYQFTCLGFDQTALGTDFCVDGNGNKLFKECKCPTNWITCPGKNNTKGRSCTALNEQGVSQEPVYESCSCDASLYKYTCEAEDGSFNTGVIPSKVNSCTPAVYKDGKREEGALLYQACSCQSSFKYNCKGNGQVTVSNEYCEQIIGGTKLYEACGCDDQFNLKCDGPGEVPPANKPSAICTPANPDLIYNETGIKILYSECSCSNEYSSECNGTGQIPDGYGCTPTGGVEKYKNCNCSEEYQYTCTSSGENKGVEPSGTPCSKIQNGKETTKLYQSCGCKEGYNKKCFFSSDDMQVAHINEDIDYCEKTDYDGTKTKLYKVCTCPPSYNQQCDGENEPTDQQYCLTDGNIKLYRSCKCTTHTPEGYKLLTLDTGAPIRSHDFPANKEAFKKLVKTECGHEDNYVVVSDDDGNPLSNNCKYVYWKCANDKVRNASLWTDDSCAAEAPQGSVAYVLTGSEEVSWEAEEFGLKVPDTKHTSYTGNCDCPASYDEPEDCSKALQENGRCTYDGSDFPYQKVVCEAISPDALKPWGDYCQKKDGTKYYKDCDCNRAIFVFPSGSKGQCLCPGADSKLNKKVWTCIVKHKDETCSDCSMSCNTGNYAGQYVVSSNYGTSDCSGK